ncbi:MAG: Ig-like domain-containing protein [Candidatus Saganbacteria bacterium]|nr:Ig-like domain-containing protein [Candidatus Saganbacteria bacterium]
MKRSLILVILISLVGSVLIISGCQEAQKVADILQVLSVSPALDATDIASDESLSITFNFPLDESGITQANLFGTYLEYFGGQHTAGDPMLAGLEWSADGKTLTIRVNNWSGLAQGNNRVAIRATNRIKDIFGNDLGAAPVLWRFRLHYQTVPTTTTTSTSTTSTSTTTSTTTTTMPDWDWTQATASADWSNRMDFSSVVFDDKIWVIGGFTNTYTNEVWASSDGTNWDLMTAEAAFGARKGHTSVVFDDKIWVIGGYSSALSYTNEVWSSGDGVDWQLVTPEAAFPGRQNHTSLVYDGKMWVIGGLTPGYSNDVYYSTDGVTWLQATAAADFTARSGHASAVYDNKMWVIGGRGSSYVYDDVWSSVDGATWQNPGRVTAFFAPPPPASSEVARTEHAAVAYSFNGNEYLFITGGYRYIGGVWTEVCFNDLRYTSNGSDWTSVEAASVYTPRGNHASVVFDDKIWVLGGADSSTGYSDVWYSPKP